MPNDTAGTTTRSQSSGGLRLLLGAALVATAALAYQGTRPPVALGPNAAPTEFSAARALPLLRHFADRTHAAGTGAQERARQFLIGKLTSLGAEVRVEKPAHVVSRRPFVRQGSVQNIVATFRGRGNTRAIMLVAHYDSVPEGPGAADDGAGVISILETLRALHAGPALRNDLIVLYTDGEEAGLLGAAGFVAEHPDLAERVGIVINLEARGSSGPVLMFETSDQNGWLIQEFARAAPYPMASSLMYAAYQLLPNDTDLTELKKTGVGALNFAFTETVRNYHTRFDTAENVDPRSVQQMGANTIALARHFGNLPLQKNIRQPDCVYFNWLGSRLIYYPLWVAWLLALTTVALLAFVLVVKHKRGTVRPRFWGVAAFPLLLLVINVGTFLAWSGIKLLFTPSNLGDTVGNRLIFGGLIAIGLVAGAALLRFLSRRIGELDLTAGLLLSLSILGAVDCFLLPGSSYLLQWPAFFGAAGLLLGLQLKNPHEAAWSGLVAALPTLLIVVPLSYFFFVGLGLNVTLLVILSLLLSLLLAAAWPLFDVILRPWRWLAAGLLFLALALFVLGATLSDPGQREATANVSQVPPTD
ncbi:MAG: M20/M25/M40 family metallo-hydrolase [Spartobacteria bacterium]